MTASMTATMAALPLAPAAPQPEVPQPDRLLTKGQAAKAAAVPPVEVDRWIRTGMLKPARRTKGGHGRFRESDARALAAAIRGPLVTPARAAELARVSLKALTAWADAGKVTSYRGTGRGHRRYLEEEMRAIGSPGQVMGPGEASRLLRVHPETVTRWAAQGKLPFTVTPSGRRRYREADVLALLNGTSPGAENG